MEGSVTGSAAEAATALADAANTFVDEAQAVANAGVDTAQVIAEGAIGTALAAIETAIAGVKHLVSAA